MREFEITDGTRRTRRGVLGVLSAGTAAGVLAACGTQQSTTGQSTTGQGSSAAQSGGLKTLPAATISFETFRGVAPFNWGDEMGKTFQEKNPNVKVEVRPIALEGGNQQSAYPKMLASAQAGTLADVHSWDPSHWQMHQAIKRSIIQPLDTFIARDKYDLGQFYKPFIEYMRWEGKVWGLPSWGWTSQDGILFNTEMVQAAGVTIPDANSPDWNLNKIYEIAVKVGKFAERNQGFGLVTSMPSATSATIWTRASNGDNLSADGKKSTLLDAAAKEGMRWLYDLAHKERVIAVPGTFEGSVDNLFVNGKVGLNQQGSLGVFNTIRANANGLLKFKAQLLPKRRDGKRPSQLRGGSWNMNKTTKFPDHSWAFLQHLSSREGALKFNTIGGNGAIVRPDIMNDDYFKDPNFRVYLENFENSMPAITPANFRGTEFEATFSQFSTPWYKGEVGFEDGLTTLNTEVQKILDMPQI